uniref:C-type lectin domain family 2 member H-like isoform X2 n=1 Tax=Myodes glareolus TaxID=447135 RepID=UPI002021C177|nr:C-type lectin domain family 2 member H-like isoform X2 [Myodes glareolus]
MSEERRAHAELTFFLRSKKDKKQSAKKNEDSQWHMTAVILGTVCLCLTMSNAVLGYAFNEAGPSTLLPTTEKGYYTCQGRWSCCGENCYYFSEEEKTWSESEASCRVLGSHLAKIDNSEEQNFIQSRLNYSYWVGSRKNERQFQWVNQKDTKLSSDLHFLTTHSTSEECGYLKPMSVSSSVCSRHFRYICEKNFPFLVTSKN